MKYPALILAFAATASSSLALDFVWNNTGTGDWATGTNWTPAGPPSGGGGNFALINNGGTANISASTGAIQDPFIGNGAGNSGTVNHSAGTLDAAAGWTFVGTRGATGTYAMSGTSVLTTGQLHIGGAANEAIGSQAGSVGNFSMAGSASATLTGAFWLGARGGNGTAAISGGTLNAGAIRIADNDGEVSPGTGVMTITGGIINSAGQFQVGRHGGVGTVNQSGGTVNVNGGWFGIANDAPGSAGSSYTLSGGNLNLTATVSAEIGADTAGTFNLSGTGALDAHQIIVGLRSGGNGTLTQTGGSAIARGGDSRIGGDANTQGKWDLSGGTVAMGSNFHIGSHGIGTLNQTGGVFTNTGYLAVGRFSDGTGTANISAGQLLHNTDGTTVIVGEDGTGTLTLSGTGLVRVNSAMGMRIGHTVTAKGTVNLDGGTLETQFIQKTNAGATAKLNLNGGTLKALASSSDFLLGLANADVEVKAGGAKIDSNGNNITITQGLAGAGGLEKMGAGILTLTGASTYAGATTVSTGVLNLAIGSSLTSNITVAAGASVTGNGSSTGNAVVNGMLSPGNSIGQLNFGGDLILGSGSTSLFEIDNTAGPLTADLANVTGSLTYGGTLTISGTNFAGGNVFNLFDFASVSGSFSSINYPAGTTAANWVNNLGTNGTLTFVPEPGSSALVLLALAGLTRRRRSC